MAAEGTMQKTDRRMRAQKGTSSGRPLSRVQKKQVPRSPTSVMDGSVVDGIERLSLRRDRQRLEQAIQALIKSLEREGVAIDELRLVER